MGSEPAQAPNPTVYVPLLSAPRSVAFVTVWPGWESVCPWTWQMLQAGASFPESLLLDTHQHSAHRGEAAARSGAGHLPRELGLREEPLRGFKERGV